MEKCERGGVKLLVHTFKDNLLLSELGLGDNPTRFIHFLPLTQGTKSALRLACVRTLKGEDPRPDAGADLLERCVLTVCSFLRSHPEPELVALK